MALASRAPRAGNPPSRLIGRFEVERSLGKGAQGEVYLARDPQLERQVAIKAIDSAATPEEIQRLRQEARIVSQFSHPGIVQLYDAFEHDGGLYLVLEYVPGVTLAQLLKREKRLDKLRAVRIAMQVADGLAYAHAKQVIHRDIKPANIMVCEDGTARLMDFGIAAATGQLAEGGGLEGTPRYMAPERLRNTAASEADDVFSLGMVLYEMLAGRAAVTGANTFEIMHKIAHEPFEPPSRLAPDIDPRLDQLVLRAISKDGGDRHASASAMKQALAEYLAPAEVPPEPGAPTAQAAVEFLLRRMRHRSDFPALSQTISTINRIAADSDESVQALSATLLRDFALTNRLLRLVNSSTYGQFGGNISTISRAVMILGFNTVRSLAVTLILFEHLRNRTQAAQLKEEVIGSYFTGIMAHRLAARSGVSGSEEGFICGVLHHLGRLLATYYFFEESSDIASRMESGESEERATRAVLGLSYAELGVGIARHWHLPESIVQSLEDMPGDVTDKPRTEGERLKLVSNLATALCKVTSGTSPAHKQAELDTLLRKFGKGIALSKRQLETAVEDSVAQFLTEAASFVGDSKKSEVLKAIKQWTGGADEASKAAPSAGARGAAASSAGGGLAGAKSGEVAGGGLRDNQAAGKTRDGTTGEPLSVDSVDEVISSTNHMAAEAPKIDPGGSAILSAGIQDITNSLIGDFKLNDVLRIILETMYRGMGFSQVLLCTRDVQRNRMTARFGFGARTEEFSRHFNFPLNREANVFQVALDKNVDLYIADTRAPNIAARLPAWYRDSVNAPSFLLLPIVIGKSIIGLLYADTDRPGSVSMEPELLRLLKTLRNQAVLAIRQKS